MRCCCSHVRNFESCPYASSAVTHLAGSPAVMARSSIRRPSAGFVANPTLAAMPASSWRARLSHQPRGRYSSRSISLRPCGLA